MTSGAVGAVVVLALGGLAVPLVRGRRPERVPDVVLAASLALALVTTLLQTHPRLGSVGQQWQPVLGHGGGGTALRHLAAGDFDRAVQVVVQMVVVYVPLGAALGWARPGRREWLLLPVVVSVGVELAQYQWLDRVAAVDDVVIATGSAVVGWVVVTWLRRRAGTRRSAARLT